MAIEEQGPPAPEGRPEDLPPGVGRQRLEMVDSVFLRTHEEQMRRYMVASTAQLYQRGPTFLLPYHYDVLAVARQFLDADKDDVAVIMAQTACEIATDELIAALLRHYKVPPPVDLWINETTERMTTLKHPSLYRLYHTLSGNDLKKEQGRLWEAYLRRAELRNGIVHKGAHASKAQATDAYNTALDLIHHFEAVRAAWSSKCAREDSQHQRPPAAVAPLGAPGPVT